MEVKRWPVDEPVPFEVGDTVRTFRGEVAKVVGMYAGRVSWKIMIELEDGTRRTVHQQTLEAA